MKKIDIESLTGEKIAVVAKKTGLSQSFLYKVQAGERNTSYAFIKKMVAVYPHIEAEQFF